VTHASVCAGADILVVPVVQPFTHGAVADVAMFVPPGEWVDWQTLHTVRGPLATTRTFSISEHGMYVRAGGVIVTKVRQRDRRLLHFESWRFLLWAVGCVASVAARWWA
jgi:alpha-glucosidase (family GH31 glycosyl hydrolase)